MGARVTATTARVAADQRRHPRSAGTHASNINGVIAVANDTNQIPTCRTRARVPPRRATVSRAAVA